MAKDAHGTDLHVGDLVHVPYTIADIRETHEHAYVTLTAPPHGLPTAPSGVIVLSTHVLKDLPVTPAPVIPMGPPAALVPHAPAPDPPTAHAHATTATSHPAGLGPLPAQAPPDPHWNRAHVIEQE
jgi:hypothetical protein